MGASQCRARAQTREWALTRGWGAGPGEPVLWAGPGAGGHSTGRQGSAVGAAVFCFRPVCRGLGVKGEYATRGKPRTRPMGPIAAGDRAVRSVDARDRGDPGPRDGDEIGRGELDLEPT